MNKKIKLSLLGTLIAGSALAVTLPIVSCSASTDVVLTATADKAKATTAVTTAVAAAADLDAQKAIITLGNKITTGTVFTALRGSVTFVETDDTTVVVSATDAIESFEVTTTVAVTASAEIPAGVILTVHLKGGFTTENALTITLDTLGNAKA